MPWTEESIKIEFATHFDYWRKKLRMQDIEFKFSVVDDISDDQNAWVSICADNCGANPYAALVRIRRGWFDQMTRLDVWQTSARELVHVMNWSMSKVFELLTDHFSVVQLNMAKSLMKVGNEELAYKWESILSEWFAADAPPKEIP